MALTDKEREERLRKICDTINEGDFGGENKNAVMWLGSRKAVSLERFSSGDVELDLILGGGWPLGRFVEVYGPESGGKTTLCLHAIAEYQRKYPDKDIALVDTEYSFDEEYATDLGVDTKWLLVHQPDHGTQALNVIKMLIKMGVGLIVVDSVAALSTKEELEGDLGDAQVAEQARLMSKALRQLTAEAGKRKVTILWTNQMRDKIGVTYGKKSTTPGGNALKYYASIRANIRRIGTVRETVDGEEVAIANEVKVDISKNKTAPPFKVAKLYIVYGRGIDPVISIFDAAIKNNIIDKRGSWYSLEGEQLGQGRAKSIEELQNNQELFDKIKAKVDAAMSNKNPVVSDKEEGASKDAKKLSDDEVEVTDV